MDGKVKSWINSDPASNVQTTVMRSLWTNVGIKSVAGGCKGVVRIAATLDIVFNDFTDVDEFAVERSVGGRDLPNAHRANQFVWIALYIGLIVKFAGCAANIKAFPVEQNTAGKARIRTSKLKRIAHRG